MALKNHYQTLRLAPTASQEEIKRAFRKLAHQFHPDKNTSISSEAIFREIQEAYSILSDKHKKKLYDEERYFSGLSSRKEPASISGYWILKLAKELNAHMNYMHSPDINHKVLHDYVMLLLSDIHVAVLEQENDDTLNEEIIKNIALAVKKIDHRLFQNIHQRLSLLTKNNQDMQTHLKEALQRRDKEARHEKWLPYIVFATVLLLCLVMYLYSRK